MDAPTHILIDPHHGVCGCPEIWAGSDGSGYNVCDPAASQIWNHLHQTFETRDTCTLPMESQHMKSSSETMPAELPRNFSSSPAMPAKSSSLCSPSSPPAPTNEVKETCFFWYHEGRCRRGEECPLAHESRITWPMSAPPGYVHWHPCNLPLCPLRQDLVELGARSAEKKKDVEKDGAKEQANSHEVVDISSSSETDSSDSDSDSDSSTDSDDDSDNGSEQDALRHQSLSDGEEILSISHINTLSRGKPKKSAKNSFQFSLSINRDPRLPPKPAEHLRSITAVCTPIKADQNPGVCFYWYHKGNCVPKLRNGVPIRCRYLHTLDGPTQRVSLPPGLSSDHNPHCPLKLCPVRLAAEYAKMEEYLRSQNMSKHELQSLRTHSMMPVANKAEGEEYLRSRNIYEHEQHMQSRRPHPMMSAAITGKDMSEKEQLVAPPPIPAAVMGNDMAEQEQKSLRTHVAAIMGEDMPEQKQWLGAPRTMPAAAVIGKDTSSWQQSGTHSYTLPTPTMDITTKFDRSPPTDRPFAPLHGRAPRYYRALQITKALPAQKDLFKASQNRSQQVAKALPRQKKTFNAQMTNMRTNNWGRREDKMRMREGGSAQAEVNRLIEQIKSPVQQLSLPAFETAKVVGQEVKTKSESHAQAQAEAEHAVSNSNVQQLPLPRYENMVVRGGKVVHKDPVAVQEEEPKSKVFGPKPRVLVDYDLPEEHRMEWDTDFVRRTFGEIE